MRSEMAHIRGITQFYLSPTRLSTNRMNHPESVHQMTQPSEVAHIRLQLTTHLSTLKRRKAELA